MPDVSVIAIVDIIFALKQRKKAKKEGRKMQSTEIVWTVTICLQV